MRLHDVRVHAEAGEWYVGRIDTGDFVMLPEVGVRAVRRLAEGGTIATVQQELRDASGADIDVPDFVEALVGLGFVAAVDDVPIPGPPPMRTSFPRIQTRHVRWLLHPALQVALAALLAVGLVATVAVPGAWPSYHDLVWSRYGGLVLVTGAVLGCSSWPPRPM